MVDNRLSEVCAVIVTYQPDLLALQALQAALVDQVGATVIVDNTGTSTAAVVDEGPSVVLRQPENLGLAQAQNLGIVWAKARNYRYVLLLDQDSLPGEGMVASLLEAFERLKHSEQVAAVGPCFHDNREDRSAPFVRVAFPFNRMCWCASDEQTIRCDFLISSGSLIPMGVLDHVGDMNAGFFIDNVDLEWSFRARAMGYSLHGVCAATMHHRLGDARCELPLGLGQVTVHSPVRLYYMMRNRVRLYRMRHTPGVWIAQDLPRVLLKLLLFSLLIAPRWRNLHFMARGLWDGWRRQEGPCPLVRDT